MGAFILKKRAIENVPLPQSADNVTIFIDSADGFMKFKDIAGDVYTIGGVNSLFCHIMTGQSLVLGPNTIPNPVNQVPVFIIVEFLDTDVYVSYRDFDYEIPDDIPTAKTEFYINMDVAKTDCKIKIFYNKETE